MEGGVILELETDRRGRVVITLDEGAGDPVIPQRCATCLGEPTKRVSLSLMLDLEFPHCEACVPPPTRRTRRVAGILTVCAVVFLVAVRLLRKRLSQVPGWVVAVIGGGMILAPLVAVIWEGRRKSQGREGVELLLSESDTVRLAFENPEYARLFCAANGVDLQYDRLPPE